MSLVDQQSRQHRQGTRPKEHDESFDDVAEGAVLVALGYQLK